MTEQLHFTSNINGVLAPRDSRGCAWSELGVGGKEKGDDWTFKKPIIKLKKNHHMVAGAVYYFTFVTIPRCITMLLLMIENRFRKVNQPSRLHSLVTNTVYKAQLGLTLWDPMDFSLSGSSQPMGFSRQEYWTGLPFLPSGVRKNKQHSNSSL